MTTTEGNIPQSLPIDIEAMATALKANPGLLLLYIGLMIDRYIEARVSKHRLNRHRIEIMHTLVLDSSGLTASDISKKTFRSKQRITKITDSLEQDGLVKRELDDQDRRIRRIRITEKGLGSIRMTLPIAIDILNRATLDLTEEELVQLTNLMKKIRRSLRAWLEGSREMPR